MALVFDGKRRPGGSGPAEPLDPQEQALTERVAAVLRALARGTDVEAYVAAMRGLDPDALERLLQQVTIGRLGDRIEEVLHAALLLGGEREALKIIRATPIPMPTPASILEPQGVRLPNGIYLPRGMTPPVDLTPPALEFEIGPEFTRDERGRLVDSKMLEYVDYRAREYAQRRAGDLVSSIDEHNRVAIRETIFRAFAEPATVDVTARRLTQIVGLHPRWAQAVLRRDDQIYRALVKDGMTEARAREKTNVLTERYRARLIRRRAEMIARTEIAQAASAGRYAAWDAGVRTGYVDGAARKTWSTAPIGSRRGDPCPICQDNAAAQPVPWNAPFPSGHLMPPAHPHCRCAGVLVPPSRGLTGLPSQDLTPWLAELDALDADA